MNQEPRKLNDDEDAKVQPPNTKGTVTIYPKISEVVDFSKMENVFLNGDEGLDLLTYSSFANFDIKISEFMKDNFFNHSLDAAIS